MHWMEFILVVYYLLYPVTTQQGTAIRSLLSALKTVHRMFMTGLE